MTSPASAVSGTCSTAPVHTLLLSRLRYRPAKPQTRRTASSEYHAPKQQAAKPRPRGRAVRLLTAATAPVSSGRCHRGISQRVALLRARRTGRTLPDAVLSRRPRWTVGENLTHAPDVFARYTLNTVP